MPLSSNSKYYQAKYRPLNLWSINKYAAIYVLNIGNWSPREKYRMFLILFQYAFDINEAYQPVKSIACKNVKSLYKTFASNI